jgi:hypothetical protein
LNLTFGGDNGMGKAREKSDIFGNMIVVDLFSKGNTFPVHFASWNLRKKVKVWNI